MTSPFRICYCPHVARNHSVNEYLTYFTSPPKVRPVKTLQKREREACALMASARAQALRIEIRANQTKSNQIKPPLAYLYERYFDRFRAISDDLSLVSFISKKVLRPITANYTQLRRITATPNIFLQGHPHSYHNPPLNRTAAARRPVASERRRISGRSKVIPRQVRFSSKTVTSCSGIEGDNSCKTSRSVQVSPGKSK